MKVSLIGMSGSGKSFWSEQLEAHGFTRFSIDELIQQQLAEAMPDQALQGIHDIAAWMGFPYDARYHHTSAHYLALEKATLQEVLRTVKNLPNTQDIVIDTTGSVIYLDQETLSALAAVSSLVYLDIPPAAQQALYQEFLDNPKPIIWGEAFVQAPGETTAAALSRCYPELLAFRTKAYEALADHTLEYEARYRPGFTVKSLIDYLRAL